jgi:hypothetical protein
MGAGTQSPQGPDLFEVIGLRPALAARHGLSAIVIDSLTSPPPDLVQDAQAQISAGLKNKSLTLAVVDQLALAQITPILLKGYALARRLYAEHPLARPATDVDLLVHPHELDTTALALSKLGLQFRQDDSLHDPFEEHHHLSYVGKRGLVEVHFRLFTGFGGGVFDDLSLQARAIASTLDGRAIRLLAPEDEFLYLATHAANHAFLRLSWLVDLQRYLERRPPLDWSLMATRAHAAGFHTAVCTSLQLLELLFKVELPVAARRHFAPHPLHRHADALLFSKERVTSAQLSDHWLAAFLLRLWLVDSPAHGVRHLIEGARRYLRRSRSEV